MRIGLFTDTYPPFINGVATSISMLEKGLIEKGHEVYIVTVNPDNLSYKFEDDKMVELTDEQKAELFPKVEPVVEPTLEEKYEALKVKNEELEACVMELADLVGGMK